jgi:hypothetical protein
MSLLDPRSRNAAKLTAVFRIVPSKIILKNRIRSGFIALYRLQNKTIHVLEGVPETGLSFS